ncbi:hypothetical protein BKA62DRAFT_718614 [Auriculariales sp. MPI-PUGE-AT-0066]|nr:hypothetical protein BKA62DRAFT_718614 [Auriculariales sp. MPI-PUGE-AT-0066]
MGAALGIPLFIVSLVIESFTKWVRSIRDDARQEWRGNIGHAGKLLKGVIRDDDEYAEAELPPLDASVVETLSTGYVCWGRLPDDIIVSVFERYLEDAATPLRDRWKRNREGPFVLAMVCMHWRRIALATPLLWTFIGVPAFTSSPKWDRIGPVQSNENLRLTDRWLYLTSIIIERSRDAPLDVYMSQFLVCDPDASGQSVYWGATRKGVYGLHAKFLSLLGFHAHRIRSIYMSAEVDPSAVWERLGARPLHCIGSVDAAERAPWSIYLPQLRTLHVRRRLMGSTPANLLDTRLSLIILDAPQLSSLELEGTPQLLPATDTHVQKMRIYDNALIINTWLWLRVHACATSLLQLQIHIENNRSAIYTVNGPDVEVPSTIQLPALKTFILEYSLTRDPDLVSDVMSRLQISSLQTARWRTLDSEVGCLGIFLHNLHPGIQRLEIERTASSYPHTSLSEQQANIICTRFKHLRELVLQSCRVESSFQLSLSRHKPGFEVEQTSWASWTYKWES